ncbi:MAG: esterase, partial [Gammaproteobacteria bacterium]|nr:esterase [Gammaproteobacteria bacterium]
LVGSTEVLLSDSERLVERVNEAGGKASLDIWPRMPHVFPLLAGLIPEGRKAVSDIGEFVRGALGTSAVN